MASEEDNCDYDLGSLLISNSLLIDPKKVRTDEDYLKSLAEKHIQLLINRLHVLPTQDGMLQLPEPETILPREKPVPKDKAPTKWEQYSLKKGIQKKKKERKVFDEATKTWKPTYGFKSDRNKKPWLMEVPKNEDPNTDMYNKKNEERLERKSKNEYQRLKNIAKGQKLRASVQAPSKKDISTFLGNAKEANASLGKFENKLPDEKAKKKGIKRKFESNTLDNKSEVSKNLKLFETISNKKPKINVEKAVNQFIHAEEEKNRGREKKKKPSVHNISRHQKFGKLSKQGRKKTKGKHVAK